MNHGARTIRLVALSLAALLAAGTLGYMIIERMSFVDALFMAVITLSTVGFGTLKPLSTAGKLFTVALITVGVATFSYHLGNLVRMVVEEGFIATLGRHRMDRKIAQLEGHYVVCGHGRIGAVVTRELLARQVPLVILERDTEIIAALQESDVLAFHADAREEEALRRAGVTAAKGLIALLPSDADNLYVILTARELNPALCIIARANEPAAERRLLQAGATRVISPLTEGAKRIARMILNPNVTDFIEMATEKQDLQLQMEEFVVRPESPLAGKTLTETGLLNKHRILVVAVKRSDGATVFNPGGSTPIQAGDALIVLGPALQQFDF
jgi:voltage-gated potassium channel